MTRHETGLYRYQYAFIIILFCLSNMSMIGMLRRTVGTGAFSAFLFALPLGLLINVIGAALFSKNSGMTLYEINKASFGRIGGRCINLLYALYFLLISAVTLNFYGLFTIDSIINRLSLYAFLAPVIITVIYSARKSEHVLGRFSVIAGTLMLIFIGVSSVIEIASSSPETLFPLFNSDPKNIVAATLCLATWEYGQLFSAITFSPKLKNEKGLIKATVISSVIGNGLILFFAIGAVFTDGQTTYLNGGAYYGIPRDSSFSAAAGSLSVLAIAAYFFSTVFRLTVNLRASISVLKDTLSLKEEKHLALPAGVLVLALSLLLSVDSSAVGNYILFSGPYACLIFQAALPLLALIITLIKRKRGINA